MKEWRKIQLLPPEIVHRIAAGEVVDKPASILKELVENAIDAGSTKIQVTLVDGGIRSIQVEDNGCGMSRADLEACVQRHATSKITSIEELEAIPQLGFRGEALSAAASVSRLTIDTFREGDGAWVLQVTGGGRQAIKPGSRRAGTKVILEDLFFNVPARRKFLRKPGLEAQDGLDTLETLALAHPRVEFAWAAVDEKGEVRAQKQFVGASLARRFSEVTGLEAESFEVTSENPVTGILKVEIVGFKPPAASHALKSVSLSVNGRPIVDKKLPYILREAYAGLIEVGRFPCAHVSVQVDPSLIDVNIHPQKKEIRWSTGFNLGGIAYGLVRKTLAQHAPKVAGTESPSPQAVLDSGGPLELGLGLAASTPSPESVASGTFQWSAAPSVSMPAASVSRVSDFRVSEATRPPFRFGELKILGEASASWIVCESPQGIVVIDQHAAHERVNFEKELKRLNLVRSKPLFIPIRFKPPLSMRGSETELRTAMESVGFELADFETLPKDEVEIIAVPESERRIDWESLIDEIVRDLAEGGVTESVVEKLKVRVAASVACHGSVRRGQRLSNDEIKFLLGDLDAIEWGGLCPHGRPVWFLWSNAQIENLFHR